MDTDILTFITERLSTSLNLSDETYAEYISQLAADDSMERDEKIGIITVWVNPDKFPYAILIFTYIGTLRHLAFGSPDRNSWKMQQKYQI
jgi:hypothetical protein